MADRVSVQCPGCLAKLNLPDSSKLGKKIKCPKCSDIFVAEAGDDEDMDDLQDEAPAKSSGGRKRPTTGVRKGGGAKGKPSGGGGGSNGPAIAGGAVAVVALIGLGLFFSGIFASKPIEPPPMAMPQAMPVAPVVVKPAPPAISAAERILALRWMPKETDALLHVKVADLWQAPLLKQLVDLPQADQVVQQIQKAMGLTPTDVESVTFGFAESEGVVASTSLMAIPTVPPKMLIVIRTKKPLSFDEILNATPGMKSAEHGSKKYLLPPAGDMGGWIAEPTTLVMGTTAELKGAMDRGETVIPRKELTFMDSASHLIVIFAPADAKAFSRGKPPVAVPGMSAEMEGLQKALTESLTGFGLAINVRGGFDLQTSLVMGDGQAGAVKTGIDSALAEARKAFDGFKMTAPPLITELGESLLGNFKVETQGLIVRVSTNLPDSTQQKLEQLPALFMVMAMTGGMGAGGNPFAEPGPASNKPQTTSPGSFSANIGETESVAAEIADGVPEGTMLSAKTAWGIVPNFSPGTTPVQPMQLMIELKGDAVAGIAGFGQLSLKLSLAGGGTLKTFDKEPAGDLSVTKAILPFDQSDTSIFGHPEGTMRMRLSFQPPAETVTSIDSLEGTFKILTAEDAGEEFTIENAVKTAKRPLTDPALKAAGVKLLFAKSKTGPSDVLTLSCGKGFFLSRVKYMDADNPSGTPGYFTTDLEKNQSVQRLENPGFAKNLRMQFKLFHDVKEKPVLFKFGNISLPAKVKPAPEFPNGVQPLPPGGVQPLPPGAVQPLPPAGANPPARAMP